MIAGIVLSLRSRAEGVHGSRALPRRAAAAPGGAVLQPEVGGGKAERFQVAARRASRRRAGRAAPRGRSRDARPRCDRGRRRRARRGGRRRYAGDRRRDRRRAGIFRMRVSRPARATISRSTSASTATTWSARSTRSSTVASGSSTSPRSTDACSSTTCRWVSTRKRSSARGTATRSSERSLDTMPTVLGPGGDALDLRFSGADGLEQKYAVAVVLVSNNPYRLGRAIGSGTRPRLDAGCSASPSSHRCAASGWRKARATVDRTTFEVRLRRPSAAGIDGEAIKLDPPLRFASGHTPCASGSLRNTPAPHRPRPCRKARSTRSARSPGSPPTVPPSATRLQRPDYCCRPCLRAF